MKLRSLVAISAISVGSLVMAQDSGFNAGLDVQMPMGDFGDLFSLGVGAVVGYDREAGDQGLLGVQFGYSALTGGEEGISAGKMIYFMGHYKYFFSDIREGLYAAPMVGWGSVGYNYEFSVPGLIDISGSTALGGLAFGLGVGYVVNERIDLGLRWQSIRATEDGNATLNSGESSVGLSSVGLRVTYNF
jgi:hypothetical protein